MHNRKDPFSDHSLQTVSGGDLLKEKPVFCGDGKRLIVNSKSECHMYSVTTGDHLGMVISCESPIVTLEVNSKNDNHVMILTDNGQLHRYHVDSDNEMRDIKLQLVADYINKVKYYMFCDKTEEASFPVDANDTLTNVKFYHGQTYKDLIFASWCVDNETSCHVSAFHIDTGEPVEKYSYRPIPVQKTSRNFVIGSNVIVFMGAKVIAVADLQTSNIKRHVIGYTMKLTCLAMAKSEPCIATGDSLGRIILWRNVFEDRPLKCVYHWHTLPVRALCFSDHGSHIFSGGDENVLVKWSTVNQTKSFLPRLSSNILHISMASDCEYLSVSTADSKILIINLNLSCVSTIQHFSNWSSLSLSEHSGICTHDARSNAIVVGGRTGHIQFISLSEKGKFLYTVDVTNVNYRTQERDRVIENVEVRFVRFTKCGKWMITAETGAEEARLKFWNFDEKKQNYNLNTNVESPHGDDFYCLEVGSDDLAVTTGPDNEFRLWTIAEVQHLQTIKYHWTTVGQGNYRNTPITVADFARDGSAVGVGFGPTLTVWDTDDSICKCNLTPPLKRHPITVIRFGNNQMCHLVVTGTEVEITTWNLVTLCMQWVVPLQVSTIIRDVGSSFMCAFSKKHGLFIFQPASPTPEIRLEKVCDSDVIGGVFVAHKGSTNLYFLTADQTLLCYGQGKAEKSKSVVVSNMTPFVAHQAKISTKDVLKNEPLSSILVPARSSPVSLLEGGAHTQPPISLLCNELLRGLLLVSAVPERPAKAVEEIVEVKSVKKDDLKSTIEEAELRRTVDCIFGEKK